MIEMHSARSVPGRESGERDKDDKGLHQHRYTKEKGEDREKKREGNRKGKREKIERERKRDIERNLHRYTVSAKKEKRASRHGTGTDASYQ